MKNSVLNIYRGNVNRGRFFFSKLSALGKKGAVVKQAGVDVSSLLLNLLPFYEKTKAILYSNLI